MARQVCTIEGCSEVVNGHGLCNRHYLRWKKYGDPLGGKRNQAPAIERFARRVKKGGPNGCWIWTGPPTNAGYGIFQIGGKGSKVVSAHRFSYETYKGLIPEGLHIMHSCDNRLCVNPAHLSVGTARENALDCIQKGRHARMAARGVDCGNTVLTPELVRYIRSQSQKSHAALARELGCGPTTIHGVRTGRVWSHID